MLQNIMFKNNHYTLVTPNVILKKTSISTTVKANSVLHIHIHALFATLQLYLGYVTTSDNTKQGLCCNYITTGHFIPLTLGHKHGTIFPRQKPIYIHNRRRLNSQVLNINRSHLWNDLLGVEWDVNYSLTLAWDHAEAENWWPTDSKTAKI